MKRLKLFFLLLATITTFFAKAQTIVAFKKTATNPYGFIMAAPTNGVVDNMPCIIHLHGVGGQGDGGDSALMRLVRGELPQELQKAAEKYKMVVIAPQVGDWNYTGAINHVKKYAIDVLKVDPDQIHLWGLSAGGSGVTGYVSASVSNASQFATAVSVCGAGTVSSSGGKNVSDAKLPMIFFHAQDDGTVSVSNSTNSVTNINNYNPLFPAKKVIYSAGQHWIWGKVYNPDVWPWIGNESQGLYEWALSNTRLIHKLVPESAPSTEMIARAGDDFITTSQLIKLDGSKSTNYKSAEWRTLTVPAGVNYWGVNACSWIWCENVKLGSAGDYTFELKCFDSKGAFKTDTVKVTYNPGGTVPPPPPPPTKTIIARLFVGGFEVIVYSDKTAEVK
jgi:predicted esterase